MFSIYLNPLEGRMLVGERVRKSLIFSFLETIGFPLLMEEV
jgi:hypothetical protein